MHEHEVAGLPPSVSVTITGGGTGRALASPVGSAVAAAVSAMAIFPFSRKFRTESLSLLEFLRITRTTTTQTNNIRDNLRGKNMTCNSYKCLNRIQVFGKQYELICDIHIPSDTRS